MLVHSRELGEVESECTSYNFRLFAIFVPKIVRFGGSLTLLIPKIILLFFLRHGVQLHRDMEVMIDW